MSTDDEGQPITDPAAAASEEFGESNPVGDNSTAESRQQNRRVELVVR